MATTLTDGTVTATLVATKAEVKTVTATIGAVMVSTTVPFYPGPASQDTSSVAALPTSIISDGMTTSTITVTVVDAQNNPINGQQVSLDSSGSGNTILPPSGPTGMDGTFSAAFSSTKAEAKTIDGHHRNVQADHDPELSRRRREHHDVNAHGSAHVAHG